MDNEASKMFATVYHLSVVSTTICADFVEASELDVSCLSGLRLCFRFKQHSGPHVADEAVQHLTNAFARVFHSWRRGWNMPANVFFFVYCHAWRLTFETPNFEPPMFALPEDRYSNIQPLTS